MSTRFESGLLWLLPGLLVAGCSGQPADPDTAFDAGCAPPAGVVLTKPQAAAAIAGIKTLFAGRLSFEVEPRVVRILTDSRRADLIVSSLICTAEKRGAMTSTDSSRVEYTRKLFLYTWGTSPLPGPEDVQAWTNSHPYSNVTPDLTPSVAAVPFTQERLDVTDPNSDTCTAHVIPAGVPVCVRVPAGSAVGLYATEAHDHGVALTSSHPAQPANWFKQNIDYAICARPTSEPPASDTQHSPMALDIASQPRDQCLGAEPNDAPPAVK